MIYKLEEYGISVQEAIDKIQALDIATDDKAGLLSPENKRKLDALNISIDSTEGWAGRTYVPALAEIVIYSDFDSYEESGETINIPNFKVGNGEDSVGDLPFVGAKERQLLLSHIADNTRHITANERTSWNGKVRIDESDLANENLIFTL